MYIIIEGDNGSGKDTLAQSLTDLFDIVTYRSEVQQKMDFARNFKGRESALNFLGYNELCVRFVEDNAQKGISSLLIRSWPSTVAAAYADQKLAEVECDLLVDYCITTFTLPDLLVYLKCDHNERVRRIIERNSPNFDDKTVERAERYAYYSKKVFGKLGNRVHVVVTSGKTRQEVQAEVRNLINRQVEQCVA